MLGAILINNNAWHEVSGFLRPEHFYEPVHGRLFGALDRTIRAGHLADHILLNREFNDDDALKELDGAQYLARLARAAETIVNAGDYGRLLHDLFVKRGIIAAAEAIANQAYDPQTPTSAAEMLDSLEHQVAALCSEFRRERRKTFRLHQPRGHRDRSPASRVSRRALDTEKLRHVALRLRRNREIIPRHDARHLRGSWPAMARIPLRAGRCPGRHVRGRRGRVAPTPQPDSTLS